MYAEKCDLERKKGTFLSTQTDFHKEQNCLGAHETLLLVHGANSKRANRANPLSE